MSRGRHVDLHRHLEGSIRPSTALELGRAAGVFPADLTLEALVERTVVRTPSDLLAVLDRFDALREPVRGYDAVVRISREAVEDAADEGVGWLNLRFSPSTLSSASGVGLSEVFSAVTEGIEAAGTAGAEVAVEPMVIISRRRGLDAAWRLVDTLEQEAASKVVGADFASDEVRHTTAEFAEVARALSSLGLSLTVHTGEGVGSSAVAQAIELPGVRRLGHALSLVDDAGLMVEVVGRGLVVEVCPTSNVRCRTVPSYAEHPARAMREAGVATVICTDDPALFGIDLAHELAVARTHLGYSEADLAASRRRGREVFMG